ncbi:MAG TPA: hypothetical protein VFB66_29805 [Tepidisphaeraceae bacterium]|nr:hypothetical protein [Tepidisphaeraceae bacterium]
MSRFTRALFAFVAFAVLQLAWTGPAYARRYSLTELPQGPDQSLGFARLNDVGQVAGVIGHISQPERPWNGFVWSRDSGLTDLGEGMGAFSINNAGAVVGRRYHPQEGHDAFLWTATEGVRLLSSLPGGQPFESPSSTEAVGINDAGQIVGHIRNDSGTRAFIREPDGVIRYLPMPPGAATPGGPFAFGINDRGDVVGRVHFGDGRYRAFLWPAAGGYHDLGDLPGGLEQGTAVAINNRGEIVGSGLGPADPNVPHSAGQQAVRFFEDGRIIDLGVPVGMSDSSAEDINDLGEVVGGSRYGSVSATGAILWTADGTMLDLNKLLDDSALGWTLTSADSINNSGQILVSGQFQGRYAKALLTPVPEPAAVGLLLALLPLVGGRRGCRAGANGGVPEQVSVL